MDILNPGSKWFYAVLEKLVLAFRKLMLCKSVSVLIQK